MKLLRAVGSPWLWPKKHDDVLWVQIGPAGGCEPHSALQGTTAAAEAERDEAQAQLQKAQEQMQELQGRAEGGSAALQQVGQLKEQVSPPLLTAQLALWLLPR